jgi:adenine-specific DNA-methyltransferase
LNPNGRCAYIIPSEFLNSDYGKLVKTYLIKSKTLRHIFVIDFEQNVFDDALTTASIIFCANDNLTDKVQFSNIKSLRDLKKVDEVIYSYPNFSETSQTYTFAELNPNIKWKAYYQKQNGIKFQNLVPFSKYAKVVRGIATGSNDFFIFNKSKAEAYEINEKYLLPCICKGTVAQKSIFTEYDFEKLKSNDKNVFLLDALNSNDVNVKKYLKKGEEEGIDKKYLTASRKPWYSLENRPPSPIWVTVFNRTGLRFIRNEANISNLTSYHCIYPKQTALFDHIDLNLLFAYLLTETAKQILEDNSREYGNGLQKFEPNDINKGQMLDLAMLDDITKEQILGLYFQYRNAITNDLNAEQLLKDIDGIFLNYFL